MADTFMADSLASLAELIKAAKIGMFTAVTADGLLHSRPLVTRQVDLEGNALWFFMASNFPKAEEILHDKEVAVSYALPDHTGYIAISGHALVVHDHAKAEELWTPMNATRFPKGPDDPRLVLLRVKVEAVQYWDSP